MKLDWIDQICEALKEVIYTFKTNDMYCECKEGREVNIINGKYICIVCNKSLMNLTIDQIYGKDAMIGIPSNADITKAQVDLGWVYPTMTPKIEEAFDEAIKSNAAYYDITLEEITNVIIPHIQV